MQVLVSLDASSGSKQQIIQQKRNFLVIYGIRMRRAYRRYQLRQIKQKIVERLKEIEEKQKVIDRYRSHEKAIRLV